MPRSAPDSRPSGRSTSLPTAPGRMPRSRHDGAITRGRRSIRPSTVCGWPPSTFRRSRARPLTGRATGGRASSRLPSAKAPHADPAPTGARVLDWGTRALSCCGRAGWCARYGVPRGTRDQESASTRRDEDASPLLPRCENGSTRGVVHPLPDRPWTPHRGPAPRNHPQRRGDGLLRHRWGGHGTRNRGRITPWEGSGTLSAHRDHGPAGDAPRAGGPKVEPKRRLPSHVPHGDQRGTRLPAAPRPVRHSCRAARRTALVGDPRTDP